MAHMLCCTAIHICLRAWQHHAHGSASLPLTGVLLHWHRGLHFLAIQADEDAEESAGLWLLQEQSTAPV